MSNDINFKYCLITSKACKESSEKNCKNCKIAIDYFGADDDE